MGKAWDRLLGAFDRLGSNPEATLDQLQEHLVFNASTSAQTAQTLAACARSARDKFANGDVVGAQITLRGVIESLDDDAAWHEGVARRLSKLRERQ